MTLVTGGCRSLSLTTSVNIIAVLSDTKRIAEYTRNGCLIRWIYLDICGPEEPRHCIQLSNGLFIVSCWGEEGARVISIDTNGTVIKSYGGLKGSVVGQMINPYYLAVDQHSNVLVTDFSNNRIELLCCDLNHLGFVAVPKYGLNGPHAVHIDVLNRRLYIGEHAGGHLFVLASDTNETSSSDVNDKVI